MKEIKEEISLHMAQNGQKRVENCIYSGTVSIFTSQEHAHEVLAECI